MSMMQSDPQRHTFISPVPRKLNDQQVFIWGAIWSLIVIPILVTCWAIGKPHEDFIFSFLVFIGVLLSSPLTGPISRVDTTLVLSPAPALLLILLESTTPAAALALWGTAYFLGMLIRLRHLGDAAETTAYLLGCGLVCIAVLNWFSASFDHALLADALSVLVFVCTRLIVSAVRLSVVTQIRRRDALRALLPLRIFLFTSTIILVVWAGHGIQRMSDFQGLSFGVYDGGAVTIFFIGVVAFVCGSYLDTRALRTQLNGTLDAALRLPWGIDQNVNDHALFFTQRALPQYQIEIREHIERNLNEITSKLGNQYLVACRGSSQSAFLTQEQRTLDAIAHIAETMALTQREHESLSLAATTDELTGLPNYRAFRRALEAAGQKADGGIAIAYVDIDGFKEINDTYGHETGNAVLRAIASRMRGWLPAEDFVARVGGDEFVLILTGVTAQCDRRRDLMKLIEEVSAPIPIGDHIISVSLSYGIATAEENNSDVSALVVAADEQMYMGRGRHMVESTRERARIMDGTHDVIALIATAIRERSISFAYQPIIDEKNSRIIAIEALVRPHDAALADVPIEMFIDEVRRLGLLPELSIHMLHTTAADMVTFRRAAPELNCLHINIDIEQVTDPAFIAALHQAQNDTGVDFTLELSETSLDRSTQKTQAALAQLRAEAGVRIALDDFGCSSSTLLAIVEYPLDVLKIDKAMIKTIDTPKSRQVLESIAELSATLGVQMIVEGVEDQATYAALVHLGAHFMQGYYYSQPLSAELLLQRLTDTGVAAHISEM